MSAVLVDLSRDSLINALQHVLRAVSPNSPIPILAGMHIQVYAHEIVFTASNTSLTIQCTVSRNDKSFHAHKTGSIVVPARYFNEVIRKLSAESITLEIKKHLILSIISGNSHIRLCGMDPAEFPSIINKEYHSANKLRISSALLKMSIKQVASAASISEMRPVLTGVSFDYNNDSLCLVATDGIRLASKTLHTIKRHGTISTKILIPAKNLYEVSKMLRNDDETIEIDAAENQIRISSNDIKIESALIEGAFPSVSNVIPKSYLTEIVVVTTQLLRAVECVSVLADESIIRLASSGNSLELLSRTAEIGDVQDEVSFIHMSGDEFSIALNGKYLIDILRSIGSEYVKLRFNGKTSPVVLIPEDTESSTLFLLTPIRTHD